MSTCGSFTSRTYLSKGKKSCADACGCTRRPVTMAFTKPCCGDERLNRNIFFENIQNNPNAFITTWRTTTPNEQIRLPVGGEVDFYVLWGDGSFSKITSSVNPVTHTYTHSGEYTVIITGSIEQWDNNLIPFPLRTKLIDVVQFGKIGLKKLNFVQNTSITTFSASDVPDKTITDMSEMFLNAIAANPDVSKWDVSNVTNMRYMFSTAVQMKPNVSKWDVSNVTNMEAMFYNAPSANPDVSKWDVSNVTNMAEMFRLAISANPDVSKWNVSKVTNMFQMFWNATSADPDISLWQPSSLTTSASLFNFMRSSGFTQNNYNKALIMFNAQTSMNDVQWQSPTATSAVDLTFQINGNTGSPNGNAAFIALTDPPRNWIIQP